MNDADKAKLRSLGFTECKKVENLRITAKMEKQPIPSNVLDIFDIIKMSIQQEGFWAVRCNPRSTNCIVRTFCSEITFERMKYRVYGAQIYTKNHQGKWHTGESHDNIRKSDFINFGKFVKRIHFSKEKSSVEELRFCDFYLKVSYQK